jgi:hypothetical protein
MWSLSAVRAVKSIHRTVRQTAQAHVFKPLNEVQAMALVADLQKALMPFCSVGLVTGLAGRRYPQIEGAVDRTPSQPSLIADIRAQLQPWNRSIRMRVSLKPDAVPRVEVL